MRKNVRRNMIATFGLSAVAFFAGAVGLNVNAKAAEETVEQPTQEFFVDGAGVYVGGFENGVDTTGFRFRITAKSTLIASGATIGALVLPADFTAETELKKTTVLNDGTDSQALIDEVFEAGNWVQHEKYADYKYTCVYLYNYQPADYNRDILCNAYVVDGETTTYATTLPRSMSEVALAAENDGDTRASGYIKNYNVNYFGSDGVTEVDGLDEEIVRYGSLIEEPETPADTATQTFVGWYADKECTKEFDFTNPAKGTTNIYSKWEEIFVSPFATTVNTISLATKANFAYGDGTDKTTDWYYNTANGELTKTFSHQTGGSDFNDRVYLAEAQTGDFTFEVTATLGKNTGFEFAYSNGNSISRFFIGRTNGNTSMRVCIGDAATSVSYGYMGLGSATATGGLETTFKFLKTSDKMEVYITNEETGNKPTLAITITKDGITKNYTSPTGTSDSVDNAAAVAKSFSGMFKYPMAIGFTAVGGDANSAVYKNILLNEKTVNQDSFVKSVDTICLASRANLTYGDGTDKTTDWYYNTANGELTKTFSHQTGGSDFNDRVYLAEAQTGDFTFEVTATLGKNTGFEFTYGTGNNISRFFIGRSGNTSIRVCIGDAATSVSYGYMGVGSATEALETTFTFVKTSDKMEVYIKNAYTSNEKELALTITSTGITRNYEGSSGTSDSVDNAAAVAKSFSGMFKYPIAIGFTAVGGDANSAVYKNISIE